MILSNTRIILRSISQNSTCNKVQDKILSVKMNNMIFYDTNEDRGIECELKKRSGYRYDIYFYYLHSEF